MNKIIIAGPESSGKTTLSNALKKYFNTLLILVKLIEQKEAAALPVSFSNWENEFECLCSFLLRWGCY